MASLLVSLYILGTGGEEESGAGRGSCTLTLLCAELLMCNALCTHCRLREKRVEEEETGKGGGEAGGEEEDGGGGRGRGWGQGKHIFYFY